MPTVRSSQPGSVQQRPVQTPVISPESIQVQPVVGSTASQQLNSTSAELRSSLAEMQERKDKANAKDAFVAFGDQVRTFRSDFQTRQKKDAIGSTAEAQMGIEESMTSIEGGLENDRQRELFLALAASKRTTFLDTQATYEAAQLREWELESSDAMIADAIDFAGDNYTQKDAIQNAREEITLASATATSGMSKEAADLYKKERLSGLHQTVISRMVVNSASAAKEYYDKWNEEILTSVKSGIEEKLKTIGVTQASQDNADDIFLQEGQTNQEQLDEARKIKDPEIRDATVQRVKVRQREVKLIEDEEKQGRVDTLSTEILDMHRAGASYENALDVTTQMATGTDRNNLRQLVNSLYLKRAGVTNVDKYLEARRRIDQQPDTKSIENREQLYTEYFAHLSDTDFPKLEQYWQSRGAEGQLTNSRVQGIYTSVTGTTSSDLAVSQKKRDDYNEVWNHIIESIDRSQKITDTELRKLVNQTVVDGERRGGGFGFGEDLPYLEAKKIGRGDSWLPDISSEETTQLTKFFEQWNAANPDEFTPITDLNLRILKRVNILQLSMTQELRDISAAEAGPQVVTLGNLGSNQ